MIDTDKYEGHSPAPWLWYEEDEGLDLVVADDQCRTVIEEVKALNTKADEQLIADAPLLLAEVKQIHEILREAFTTEAKHSGAEYLNMIARITGLIE
tara:strand:+ start:88 stop:378 length:291 start_codon:yes stop_codon:yes gene_type:complete